MRFLFTDVNPVITHGLGRTLTELGETVEIVDVGLASQQDPNFLERTITSFNPDYVCSQGGWGGLGSIIFPILRRKGIPHIFWASEDPMFFESLSLPMARNSQYVFTTAAECIDKYLSWNIKAHLMLFACSPSFHHRVEPNPRFNHDCIFIGNNYSQFPTRLKGMEIILKPLIENGFDLKVYGLDWWLNRRNHFYIEPKIYGGGLTYEEMRTAYSSAKIVLGLHSVDTSPTMMSMRTFDVLGCGAFYLTQWTPAIENLFSNHDHLVWSKSQEETVELVNYYLARPEERQRIARKGQAEVYAKHTYKHRVEEFLKVLKTPDMGIKSDSRYYSFNSNSNRQWHAMRVGRVKIKAGKPQDA
ncbi:MAG: glycosyltransferase [Bacillota bacterium]